MNRKLKRSLSALLLAASIAVTQIPAADVEAQAVLSDFQIEGNKLLRYAGTAEVVSVPVGIKEIGQEAFAGNDDLIKVNIGEEVERIGYGAFADCDNLRTISVGDSVTEIASAAFCNNQSLVNVTLGEGVRKIGDGVFAGCGSLKDLTLSEENPYLYYSSGILYNADRTKLYALMPGFEKEAYTMPSEVEEIAAYAFWGNLYLEQVKLGSGLSSVPAFSFSNCMNLKQVSLPLPIHSIEAKAFADCVNLEALNLPESVSRIHETAFDGCGKLQFTAVPGTYGGEFAASFQSAEADRVEYEEAEDSEVLSPDELTEEESREEGQEETEKKPSGKGGSMGTGTLEEEDTSGETQASDSEGSGRLLGESSIVAGRAMIFIDNSRSEVATGKEAKEEGTGALEQTRLDLGDFLSENVKKGGGFPKYTVVNGKIASQAHYKDRDLTEYTIEEGITEIGDFAFARSNLTSIVIPEGVEKIGYGAFYHCDRLAKVELPDSVTEIEANAFSHTPWADRSGNVSASPYLVAGDGILIAYYGSDSVVNIPAGVKTIGPEVFKDHMGITAVNLPDSVERIGECAFDGCKNLTTVNGGKNLKKVGDRAFFNCPLSTVTIPASMEEIGLAAYHFSGGTDTVTFEGELLPKLSPGEHAGRLSNEDSRDYAFGPVSKAIVPDGVTDLEETVLEKGAYGFKGQVYRESGELISDNREGAVLKEEKGISLKLHSQVISSEGENTMATMPGNSGSYLLEIMDSESAGAEISEAYSQLYGGLTPYGLHGFDMTLLDASGSIPIRKLGKQYMTVQLPKPSGTKTENIHVVTLDEDGQLEDLECQLLNLEDGDYIQFTTRHFSPFAVYNDASISGQGVVTDGKAFINLSGNKDKTPDTGDPIHPKWFLAAGLLAAAVALFFHQGKRKESFR